MVPRKTWDEPLFQWKPLIEPTSYSAIDWPRLEAARRWEALLSTSPPSAYRDGDCIVTPGYHNDPQGDAMSSEAKGVFIGSAPTGYITLGYDPDTIQISYEPMKPNKEQPMSETAAVVNDLRRLADKGEDINAISKEVDRLKTAQKHRIVNGLKGLADLAILEKPMGSRFVVAYWKDNEAGSLEGIDYAKDKSFPADDEEDESRVYVQPGDFPVSGEYYTMKHFKALLDNREIPYHIAYFD